MTSKDKAKELFEKYKIYVLCQSTRGDYDDHFEKENAKKCAIIAIDEIVKELIEVNSLYELEIEDNLLSYWNDVKKEIEIL